MSLLASTEQVPPMTVASVLLVLGAIVTTGYVPAPARAAHRRRYCSRDRRQCGRPRRRYRRHARRTAGAQLVETLQQVNETPDPTRRAAVNRPGRERAGHAEPGGAAPRGRARGQAATTSGTTNELVA
jgi:hypothetical protein